MMANSQSSYLSISQPWHFPISTPWIATQTKNSCSHQLLLAKWDRGRSWDGWALSVFVIEGSWRCQVRSPGCSWYACASCCLSYFECLSLSRSSCLADCHCGLLRFIFKLDSSAFWIAIHRNAYWFTGCFCYRNEYQLQQAVSSAFLQYCHHYYSLLALWCPALGVNPQLDYFNSMDFSWILWQSS